MWASSVWGFLSLGVTFALGRLSMLWTHGYEWLGPWLIGASAFSFLMAIIMLLWPFVFPQKHKGMSMGNTIGTIQNNAGIITQGQTGGSNTVINHEDKSPVKQLSDLFNQIDPRIVNEIQSGKTKLVVRMQKFQIVKLNEIIMKSAQPLLIDVAVTGRKYIQSMIANGTFGPSHPVAEQTEVSLTFNSKIF